MKENFIKIIFYVLLPLYILSNLAVIILPIMAFDSCESVAAIICSACVCIVTLICLTVCYVQNRQKESAATADDSETKEILEQIKEAFSNKVK